jgi:hypothetical protein
MPASRAATWSTKPAVSRADLSPATSVPIPERVAVSTAVSCQTGPMPSGLADREGVQGDQVAGAGGEVAEPERAVLGRGGHDPGGGCGELGQGSDPLGPSAEPVATQDLVDPRGRLTHPTIGEVVDQLAGAQEV